MDLDVEALTKCSAPIDAFNGLLRVFAPKPGSFSLLQLPKPDQKCEIPSSPFVAVSDVGIARIPSYASVQISLRA